MQVHNVEQGTEEWHALRVGVITASDFSKVITPKTRKLSSQAGCLANKLAAQIITGRDECEFDGNGWTERGKLFEPDAVELYEMLTNNETQEVGFITNDEKTIGCSPDRLVGEDGGLEIKCPAAHTHVKSLLDGTIADDHRPQVQGCLYVTGRKWWDCMSYHPELPPSIIRVERDEEFIADLETALKELLADVQDKIKRIKGE